MTSEPESSRTPGSTRRVSLTGKAPVSKTGVAARSWGFESLTLRWSDRSSATLKESP